MNEKAHWDEKLIKWSKSKRVLPLGRFAVKTLKCLSSPVRYMHRRVAALPFILSKNSGSLVSREGYVFIGANNIKCQQEVVSACEKILKLYKNNERERPQVRGKKHMFNILDDDSIQDHPEILDFILSEPITTLAIKYLKRVPKLASVKLFYTPQSNSVVSSQLFHLDEVDSKQLKFFINMTDVKLANGPLTFIDLGDSAKVKRHNNHISGRLQDTEVFAVVDQDRFISHTGKKGSLLGVDTSRCFHFGSRAVGGERLMLIFNFTTGYEYHRRESNFMKYFDSAKLDAVQRLILA